MMRRLRHRNSAAASCTRCHGTGQVLMACLERSGRFRMRTKKCPYH